MEITFPKLGNVYLFFKLLIHSFIWSDNHRILEFFCWEGPSSSTSLSMGHFPLDQHPGTSQNRVNFCSSHGWDSEVILYHHPLLLGAWGRNSSGKKGYALDQCSVVNGAVGWWYFCENYSPFSCLYPLSVLFLHCLFHYLIAVSSTLLFMPTHDLCLLSLQFSSPAQAGLREGEAGRKRAEHGFSRSTKWESTIPK